MNRDGNLSFSRPPKDGGASGGLLSKASGSLMQSPSKRQKDPCLNAPPSLEQVFYETGKVEPADNHLIANDRPQMYRIQTLPVEKVSSKSSGKEGKRSLSVAEGNKSGMHHKRDILSRSTASLLTNGDHAFNPEASPAPPPSSLGSGSHHHNAVYQHIHDIASKRISTLDYFRKAHEGRVFWFNTIHFSHQDLSRLPGLSPAKLSRRATNYLLLGLSMPPVLDGHPQTSSAASTAANATAAYDFLRNLNTLLGEFETYQQIHPPDGSTQSALSRARIPHMFRRATHATTGRARRTPSNASPDIGPPLRQAPSYPDPTNHHAGQSGTGHPTENATAGHLNNNSSSTNLSISAPTLSGASASSSVPTATSHFLSFPPAPNPSQAELPNSTLFPTETPYTCLLTPPLPFAPDFYTVFATLCDVLIDAYQRIVALVNSPAVCSHGVGHGATHSLAEMFAKADAKLRKVIVGGVVREFEAATREAAKKEVAGVRRVVLGGLMG